MNALRLNTRVKVKAINEDGAHQCDVIARRPKLSSHDETYCPHRYIGRTGTIIKLDTKGVGSLMYVVRFDARIKVGRHSRLRRDAFWPEELEVLR